MTASMVIACTSPMDHGLASVSHRECCPGDVVYALVDALALYDMCPLEHYRSNPPLRRPSILAAAVVQREDGIDLMAFYIGEHIGQPIDGNNWMPRIRGRECVVCPIVP